MYSISDLVNRYGSIGGTFVLANDDRIVEPRSGYAVGNGKYSFTVALDPDLADNLAIAFRDVIDRIAFLNDYADMFDNPPGASGYGLWLDYESSRPGYLFESVRVIPDLSNAIEYATTNNQRYIYDLAKGFSIAVPHCQVVQDQPLPGEQNDN